VTKFLCPKLVLALLEPSPLAGGIKGLGKFIFLAYRFCIYCLIIGLDGILSGGKASFDIIGAIILRLGEMLRLTIVSSLFD
jgi:hypothetical protein